ncbi:MAG: chemotaxis protein CheD [Verrucomicrobiota bacterium]
MNVLGKEIVVGVGDCKVSADPNIILTTYALGSCLGITAFDPEHKIGGLLHAMLPSSRAADREKNRHAMFVDTGMEDLLADMQAAGANVATLEFKVFGGAKVLEADHFFRIGVKNVEAFNEIVSRLGLNVRALEVGGNLNRTIKLQISSGRVKVKMPNQQEFYR